MLKPGGRFVLHEFHPISTKLITSNGKKHKVTGNYFAPIIEKNPVAFTKHMPDEEKDQLVTGYPKKVDDWRIDYDSRAIRSCHKGVGRGTKS